MRVFHVVIELLLTKDLTDLLLQIYTPHGAEFQQNDLQRWIVPSREEVLVMQVDTHHWGYCVPSFISLISSPCHQLIICACQGSDTLDSLHAVGEQRQVDDTMADSADLDWGVNYTTAGLLFVPAGANLKCGHCAALQHLIPLRLNMLVYATRRVTRTQMKRGLTHQVVVVCVHEGICTWEFLFGSTVTFTRAFLQWQQHTFMHKKYRSDGQCRCVCVLS